jgi:hypothetical protein
MPCPQLDRFAAAEEAFWARDLAPQAEAPRPRFWSPGGRGDSTLGAAIITAGNLALGYLVSGLLVS